MSKPQTSLSQYSALTSVAWLIWTCSGGVSRMVCRVLALILATGMVKTSSQETRHNTECVTARRGKPTNSHAYVLIRRWNQKSDYNTKNEQVFSKHLTVTFHILYSCSSPSSGHPVDFLWALLLSPPQVWAAGEEKKAFCPPLPPEQNYPRGSLHCMLAQRHWPKNSNILFNILPNHKASMNSHVMKSWFAQSRQMKTSSNRHYKDQGYPTIQIAFGYERNTTFSIVFPNGHRK